MIQSIKKSIVMLLLVTAFTSCNQGPTLQTYYIENELKPGFASFDLPTSFINVENVDMTEEQKTAYNSVDKLNVLTFMKEDTDAEDYKLELGKVNTILKDSKYEELIRGGSPVDGKFVVKFLGDIDNIDELIVFGHAKNKGFMIARILGDDMNANKLMTLVSVLEKGDLDKNQLQGLTDFFK
ncbi:DUF4252 domain-containing protein [Winogradskyella psychrotolerans]|uniref:DUF4252 domain-containing protein n=1 Tax=Winogradskyella psychrotolerans TaxID=1344585 RepID=UPI001C07C978|nr:DUF4252 domain-containing protein [Winogradskyella psychrotolerans]MBU2929361.1 DUF4252 domain-containing protein [Winogradskyella psychrotolerans]